ncbi:hypothetical protein N7540_003315 [Penicillium herquei]|nr:hypothetical protein N7540_003315 [Penicillium herquei]
MEAIETILKHGADVKAKPGGYGPPLNSASTPDVVSLLLKYGADPERASNHYLSFRLQIEKDRAHMQALYAEKIAKKKGGCS